VGKFESALADCERAILINPNYISAYDYKAEALYHINKETGTNQLAIKTLKEGLALAKPQGNETESR
jgi:tetratricopeptide (TPR) repeat protein